MKTLLVSSSSGSHGGGEFYLHSLALGLRDQGVDVSVLMAEHEIMDGLATRFTDSGLPVHRWDYVNTYLRRGRSFTAAMAKTSIASGAQQIAKLAPDIVHINQQNNEDALDLVQSAAACGIPAVSTVHVTRTMAELGAVGGRFRDLLSRHVMKRSGIGFIGISTSSAIGLADFLGPAKVIHPNDLAARSKDEIHRGSDVYCVWNGVPVPSVRDRDAVRREWGFGTSEVVLGCVARIEQQKNPLFVVPLMKQLPEHVHLVWIGDGRLRSDLESAVHEANLSHRIHLKGWQDNATALLSGLDMFVLPSLYEGLPLAILEAMSLGLPCVVSDVDGSRDAIDSGANGFLCPVNDVDAWRQTMVKLVDDPSERNRVGGQALASHRERLSLEAMARDTLAVYQDRLATTVG